MRPNATGSLASMTADTARIAQAPPTAAETRAADIGATVPASGVPFSGLGTGPRPSPTIGTEAAPATPPVRRIYGVAVGTYFDRDRALQEAQRVGSSLNLASRALPVAEGGATMFRSVVGRFTDRAEAERMAGALTSRGLANEGRVVVIGTVP